MPLEPFSSVPPGGQNPVLDPSSFLLAPNSPPISLAEELARHYLSIEPKLGVAQRADKEFERVIAKKVLLSPNPALVVLTRAGEQRLRTHPKACTAPWAKLHTTSLDPMGLPLTEAEKEAHRKRVLEEILSSLPDGEYKYIGMVMGVPCVRRTPAWSDKLCDSEDPWTQRFIEGVKYRVQFEDTLARCGLKLVGCASGDHPFEGSDGVCPGCRNLLPRIPLDKIGYNVVAGSPPRERPPALSQEEKDIELVMSQTGADREAAVASLAKHENDIVEAIMALTL